MTFDMKPASADWEPLSLDGSGTCHGWAWFRPPAAPQGVVCRLADGQTATLRGLALATGIDPAMVSMWVVFGTPCAGPAAGGPLEMLDQLLVLPPAGSDTSIVIHKAVMPAVAVPMAAPVPVAMPIQGNPAGGGLANEGLYTAIEVHWSAIQAEIVKIDMLRKQVDGMMSELSGLNRDLNYDENTHTSRQDKDAWDDARRMMRNSHMQLSRCQKACDVGDTQSAGKKEWMQEVHDTQILPRRPIENPTAMEGEFQHFRKMLITLENQVNAALASAATDGVGRARRVLAEIATKVRKAKKV